MATSSIDLGLRGLRNVEVVGSGGSAIVYKAVRQVPGRFAVEETVAIKVLRSSWDSPARRRFEREQQVMSRLSETVGFVPILETGETGDGSPYIVMPYYEGGSLQQRIARNGPIDWPRAVRLVEQVAQTLAEAHELDVFHRDIKPANILLSDVGRPHVADFGISLIADDTASRAASTAAFTPAYSPPESFTEGLLPVAATDIYGLAATLWAILAGHAPFKDPGERPAPVTVFGRVAMHQVGDLRDRVPSPICRFIERSMAKRPENRPATMADFLAELQAAREDAYRGVEAERLEVDALVPLSETSSETSTESGLATTVDVTDSDEPVIDLNEPDRPNPLNPDGPVDAERSRETGVAADEVVDDASGSTESPIVDEDETLGCMPAESDDDREHDTAVSSTSETDLEAESEAEDEQADGAVVRLGTLDGDSRSGSVTMATSRAVAEPAGSSSSAKSDVTLTDEFEPESEPDGAAWIGQVLLAAIVTLVVLLGAWWLLGSRPTSDDGGQSARVVADGDADVGTDFGAGRGDSSSQSAGGRSGDGADGALDPDRGDVEPVTDDGAASPEAEVDEAQELSVNGTVTTTSSLPRRPSTVATPVTTSPTTIVSAGRGDAIGNLESGDETVGRSTTPTGSESSSTPTSRATSTTSTSPTTRVTSTTSTTAVPPTSQISIVTAPYVVSVTATSLVFAYRTNDVCGTGSFEYIDVSTGRSAGRWIGDAGCFGPLHYGETRWPGVALEPNTTYRVNITVDGQPSNGVLPAGSGSATASFQVTTTDG